MATTRIPPPPTRYPMPAGAQAKRAPLAPARPATKFPAAGLVQAKATTRSVAPPPVKFPAGASAQAKPAASFPPRWQPAPSVVQRAEALVKTDGGKFKKKDKQKKEQAKVEKTLDAQITEWVLEYGHAPDRHVGLTDAQLDQRNIPLATTFEEESDLLLAVKSLLTANEQKLNHWYKSGDEDRLSLWCAIPEGCDVRGRERLARENWEQFVVPMPPRQFETVDDDRLCYVVGIFDKDSWHKKPKGLITCFPSDSKPS